MAGIWTDERRKVLNGAYVNFKALSSAGELEFGDEGVLAIVMPLSWGAKVTELEVSELINGSSDAKIGLSLSDLDSKVLNLVQAFKNVGKVIIYRADSGGQKATTTLGTTNVVTVTAKHSGSTGNSLAVSVTASESQFIVETFLNGKSKEKQTASTIDDLVDNAYVNFSGTGALAEAPLTYLTGGTNGSVDTTDVFPALSTYEYDVLYSTSPITDVVTLVKNERDSGHYIQALVPYVEGSGYDYEGVIQYAPQTFYDTDGVDISEQVRFYIAGVLAGASVSDSATFHAIPFVSQAEPAYTVKELEELKLNGVMFVRRRFNGDWVIEEDMNSLVSYTTERTKAYASNRVVRTLKVIHNYIVEKFEGNYIGKGNTDILRDVLKSEVASLILQLQARGVVQNFDAQRDIVIRMGLDTTSIEADLYIQPVGVLSKLYLNVVVSQNR